MITRPPRKPYIGRFNTLNRTGRTTDRLNEINALFVQYVAGAGKPVVDIGCAFGIAALAALNQGAIVIAVDIEIDHLKIMRDQASPEHRSRLSPLLARFPTNLEFHPGSLAAVHASNLLNFLLGWEIDAGVKKIFRWLMPGGKAFVIAGTPYAKNVAGFIPTYEQRQAQGARWPGECEKISDFSHDVTIQELPDFLHLLDDIVLKRTFERAGFQVEEAQMFHREGTPHYIEYDGRENVRLVATKI